MSGEINTGELRVSIQRALLASLVSVYDCSRDWSAWKVGTMHKEDFSEVLDRMEEIIDEIASHIIKDKNLIIQVPA